MSVTTMPASAEGAKGDKGEGTEEEPKGSKKKLVVVLLLVLLLVGATYKLVLAPKDEHAAPEPGKVVTMEPIQVNLAGGHYLKIGIALQLTADAHEVDGSKALDATIELFSGRNMDELTRPDQRKALKKELEKKLEHDYHGDVMGVYLTDFVTQ